MMGVNPYAVHLENMRPSDAWISNLPTEIQTALFKDAREPPEWLPEEWSGRLPTRSHAPDQGRFGGCLWVTLRHVSGAAYQDAEVLRWSSNQSDSGYLRAGLFVRKMTSLDGPWGNEGDYADVALMDGEVLSEEDATSFWEAVLKLVREMGISSRQRKIIELRAEALLRKLKGADDEMVCSTQRQACEAGWLNCRYLLRSDDHCRNYQSSFGEWLHSACAQDCGVINISTTQEYTLPEVFTLLRHSFHATIMAALRSCKPICRLKGMTDEHFFWRACPGKDGYKRHILWVVPTPVAATHGDPLQLWQQGSLHLILGSSCSGFTRMRLDPAPAFAGEAAGLVLDYGGKWEAIYESWCSAERDIKAGGDPPLALEAFFRTIGAEQPVPSIPVDSDLLDGLDENQKRLMMEATASVTPPAYDGVCGCGKSSCLIEIVKRTASRVTDGAPREFSALTRPTKMERNDFERLAVTHLGRPAVALLGSPVNKDSGEISESLRWQQEEMAKHFAAEKDEFERLKADLKDHILSNDFTGSLRLAAAAGSHVHGMYGNFYEVRAWTLEKMQMGVSTAAYFLGFLTKGSGAKGRVWLSPDDLGIRGMLYSRSERGRAEIARLLADEAQGYNYYEFSAMLTKLSPSGRVVASGDRLQTPEIRVGELGGRGGASWDVQTPGTWHSPARVATALEMASARFGRPIRSTKTRRCGNPLVTFLAHMLPDVCGTTETQSSKPTHCNVIYFSGFEDHTWRSWYDDGALTFHAGVYARILDCIHEKLRDNDETALVTFWLRAPMERFASTLEWLPSDVHERCSCTTLDSAQGREGDHAFLVFWPRPQFKDLRGIQVDKRRFYMVGMRPTKSCTILVPNEAMLRTLGTRKVAKYNVNDDAAGARGAVRRHGRDGEEVASQQSANERAKAFWQRLNRSATRFAGVQRWQWPWNPPIWLQRPLKELVDELSISEQQKSEQKSLVEMLSAFEASPEATLTCEEYRLHLNAKGKKGGGKGKRKRRDPEWEELQEELREEPQDADESPESEGECVRTEEGGRVRDPLSFLALTFDEEAIAGSRRWADLPPPQITAAEAAGRYVSEFDGESYSPLLLASACLVDCIFLFIEGKQRWVLSWPFLAWPHNLYGEWSPAAQYLSSALHKNVLQDLILRAAALVSDAPTGSRIARTLHKAGVSGDLWWKACPSDRQDSVLLSPEGQKVASCYVGGCPRVPESFEVVIIAWNLEIAAVLSLLPRFLADWGKREKRTFQSPVVRCGLWDEEPTKKDTAMMNALSKLSETEDFMAERRGALEDVFNRN